MYKITADKIKYLGTGFAKTTTGKLIFLLQIPFETLVNKKSIHPLKTADTCQIIKSPIMKTIEHVYNNQYYEYNQHEALNHLDKLYLADKLLLKS